MNVFAKIFAQIFDSSIAEDHMVRHIFMDLIVLADRDGVVDMTLSAIARRTNVPEDMIARAITRLMEPDKKSRSHVEDGRRLVQLDSHRDWGWQIVNFEHYRAIRDEESRKTYFRDYKREYRQRKAPVSTPSTIVLDSHQCPPRSSASLSTSSSMLFSSEMITQKVMDEARLSSPKVYQEINAQVKLEMGHAAGIGLDEAFADTIVSSMVTAWQKFQAATPQMEFKWAAQKFFGEGYWRDEKSWPWRNSKESERDKKRREILDGGEIEI